MVDDKLVGVFAVSTSPTLSSWDKHIETPTVYMMSDFPIAPSKYKRLSKLIIYCALSKESKMLYEGLANKRIKSLVTTAFTDNPVSMKYRGLLKQLTKKELPDDEKEKKGFSYQLNYGAALGAWTLKEGFEMWKQKHTERSE
jgi:hypothetical protein